MDDMFSLSKTYSQRHLELLPICPVAIDALFTGVVFDLQIWSTNSGSKILL